MYSLECTHRHASMYSLECTHRHASMYSLECTHRHASIYSLESRRCAALLTWPGAWPRPWRRLWPGTWPWRSFTTRRWRWSWPWAAVTDTTQWHSTMRQYTDTVQRHNTLTQHNDIINHQARRQTFTKGGSTPSQGHYNYTVLLWSSWQCWSPFAEPSVRHQFTLQDYGYGASASHRVPAYVPAFTGTHCTYPRRDGQAGLTLVAGYTLRWFIHLLTFNHRATECPGLVTNN